MLNADRTTWTFGQLLDSHLDRGTRPNGSPGSVGVPWPNKEFANTVGKHSSEGPKSERTIRNWRNGDTLPSPADLEGILQALFGGKPAYVEARTELTEAYHHARIEGEAEPNSNAAHSPTSLPTKPLRCLGRDDDLRSVIEALVAERDDTAVLVLGGPGMGKTTVTRQAAVDPAVVQKFGQRRWFVELETATNAEALEKAIIVALGLDPASARFDSALAQLGEAPGLLVLDNLETPWDAEREKAEALLAALHRVPRLALLASIRGNDSPAGVRWTRRRTMHPLEAPHDHELFLDIAPDIRADDPDLDPLLTSLGGVPIAIELVAQLAAPHDTLQAIRAEWERVGVALARRRGVEPSRLSSLEVSLELSFQSARLGHAGRHLFAILGQLPAGIAAGDLDALLGTTAFEARQGLLASGLGFERSGRLDLLPPIRNHARRMHEPETENGVSQWREHFLELAQTHGARMLSAEGAAAVRRIAPELPNLEAALRSLIASGPLRKAAPALRGIVNAMDATGLGTINPLLDLAKACRAAAEPLIEAMSLNAVGYIAFSRSDYTAARAAYEEALPLFREVAHIQGEANCIRHLGQIAEARSDFDEARKAYERALPLCRETGDMHGEANCIKGLADISLARCHDEVARKQYDQALGLFRQAGDILGEANCIQSLGDLARRRSNFETARETCEEALALYRQVGDMIGEANCIHGLGSLALARSDYDTAGKAYAQALRIFRQLGQILGEANCIKGLGNVAFQRSHLDEAREAYEQVLPLYRQTGNILGEANCIRSLGDIARESSNPEAARYAYAQALELFERIEEPLSVGFTHFELADTTEDAVRDSHRAAAREAWLSIGREDLVKKHGLPE